jgi:putative peptidoglycan lipid II flippase
MTKSVVGDRMKKTVFIVIILTMFSKLLGFARDIILSYFYGASVISDAYLISMTIPTVIFAIIGKGISTGFIPMYTRIESQEGTEQANQYTNNLANFVLILCTIIFIIGMVFTEPIVKLFASGFEPEGMELTVRFTRITLISVYFVGMNYVLSAYLQVKEIFVVSALLGLPANFVVIGSFYMSSITNINVLAIGNLLAIVVQFLLLFFYSYKKKFRYNLKLDLKDRNIRKMMLLAMPVIFGSSVAQINILVDRTLASGLSLGGISALTYANTINLIILGIVVSTITSVLFPKISKMAVENDMKGLKNSIKEAITTINIFVVPVTVFYMIFAEPIVQMLYGRGEFDSDAVALTSSALFFFAIGLVGFSQRELLSNVFYSLQDTKTPMINATIAFVINIVLNVILSRFLGIGGLALATSISVLFCSLLLFRNLRNRIGNFGSKTVMISFIKLIIASVGMGAVSKWVYGLLLLKYGLQNSLVASFSLGILLYIGAIYLLDISEMKNFVLDLKNKVKRKDIVNKAI